MITYQTTVLEEWVDYNGHLRDAFYLLIFSYATDAFMTRIGIDPQRDQQSLFTLECHLNYLHEVKRGAAVEVRTQVIAHDQKRLHLYHDLLVCGQGITAAASEQMLLHVNLRGPQSAPFNEATVMQLGSIREQQSHLPTPPYCGRTIGLAPATSGR
ncbi:hypothetical protein PMM47T1_01270 [Pseudomonas sp. M47T1]|uniref:thioesterase family protein n=1 Tax=unclassified Pseudomonas TaxID=196821 RepID=UPI0002607F5B|nr:thioesterase family protein [Pseudomonas sp. M47T1]EIK98626.1 hypothetical protein PMM47T1_01270 [Pseudomonas sp. M47T1]